MIAPKRIQESDEPKHPEPPIVVVDIGNTSTSAGICADGSMKDRQTVAAVEDMGETADGVFQAVRGLAATLETDVPTVVIASVVPALLGEMCQRIEKGLDIVPLVVGDHIPLPIHLDVLTPEVVGVDRVCAAAAAYEQKKTACVVVDFGSAITIDVVDDEGVFLGGAILPGLRMQAWALHHQTASLPEVTLCIPESAIGRDTEQAIQSGITKGTVGAVRNIVEEYATGFGSWLPAVATGGDAAMLGDACGVFDAIDEDLCLLGVGLAHQKWLDQAVAL